MQCAQWERSATVSLLHLQSPIGSLNGGKSRGESTSVASPVVVKESTVRRWVVGGNRRVNQGIVKEMVPVK